MQVGAGRFYPAALSGWEGIRRSTMSLAMANHYTLEWRNHVGTQSLAPT